jgi:SET domain-containing protein
MATGSSSPRVRIGRGVAGLGLFALERINKGRFITRYRGKKVTTRVADELHNKYLFELNTRWTIDGSSRTNVARYINHSCRPNAEPYFVKHVIKIRAIRNIKEGEEITYDYGPGYFDCFIRSAGCACIACAKKRAKGRAAAAAAATARPRSNARSRGRA